jgi:hypothetical protein
MATGGERLCHPRHPTVVQIGSGWKKSHLTVPTGRATEDEVTQGHIIFDSSFLIHLDASEERSSRITSREWNGHVERGYRTLWNLGGGASYAYFVIFFSSVTGFGLLMWGAGLESLRVSFSHT